MTRKQCGVMVVQQKKKNNKATYCQGNKWRTDGDEPNRIATIKSKQFVSHVYVVCTRMETALSP